MKKIVLALAVFLMIASLAACTNGTDEKVLRVYNWGDYIDEELIKEFEQKTGIKVIYDTFTTNEEMYPKLDADHSLYDVVCPSEYMAQKMKKNGLIQEIDWSKIPNKANLDPKYLSILDRNSDPGNKYLVPYCWGTIGILYNPALVDEVPDSWAILWDEKYKNNIIMQDSVRDAFMVVQKLLGYSVNTTDREELTKCMEKLQEQYPLVKSYDIDEVRDKMIAGDTALGVIYSGEYLYCKDQNENLEYVIPKEGTNVWYDGWVIMKGAKNVDAAHQWINFMLEAGVAYRNFEYITYPTPNQAAMLMIDEEIRNDPAVFPGDDVLSNCEMFSYLGEEAEDLYYELWKKVKN